MKAHIQGTRTTPREDSPSEAARASGVVHVVFCADLKESKKKGVTNARDGDSAGRKRRGRVRARCDGAGARLLYHAL